MITAWQVHFEVTFTRRSTLTGMRATAGHRLRYELEESWQKDPVPGSELGVKNVLQTQADMKNAIFCVCPPGTSPPHWVQERNAVPVRQEQFACMMQ